MFKTIFGKLVTIFILIIVIAFSVTGVMLSFFLNEYFSTEREEQLKDAGAQVINAVEYYRDNAASDSVTWQWFLNNTLSFLGSSTNSIIFVVDDSGSILLSNYSLDASAMSTFQQSAKENKQFAKLIQQKSVVTEIGDYNGFFRSKWFKDNGELWLTVGESFEYENSNGNSVMLVAYLHTPIKGLKQTRYEVFRYFLLSVGIAVVISFVLIYIFSIKFTRPLKQIKNAAAKISNGEFEKRLDIKSKDEIGELAQTFNQMAVALQNLEEMRRGFIANVSHELRTPMTSIRGFVEGILDGTIPPEKQGHYLTIVRDETNRLNRLVNDLLDLARMESGEHKLNIMPVDINELIRKCVINLESLFIDKKINVDADFEEESLLVSADADSIERVLYNLLHNAIKFTPENGNIGIKTRVQKNKVEVTVKDNGIGIDESEINMIWDRFYKSDKSRGKDRTGTGLGLAIIKNIINEHGQKIWVESKPGEGSSFTFTLERAYERTDAE